MQFSCRSEEGGRQLAGVKLSRLFLQHSSAAAGGKAFGIADRNIGRNGWIIIAGLPGCLPCLLQLCSLWSSTRCSLSAFSVPLSH